jgi:dienelactone hydrolase
MRKVLPILKRYLLAVILMHVIAGLAFAQTDAETLGPILGDEIIPPAVGGFQVRQYLVNRVAPPPVATSAEQWTAQAQKLRQQMLDVAYHGWPKEWVNSPSKFEDLGVIEGGKGYKLRKLRYEIVPGFQSTAILYEPENLQGKVPAVLNVHGHVGAPGKAVEFKQKRCIAMAKHGMLALNLEWFSFGELGARGNEHWFGAHLDLVGMNEMGLFYLAMRRGLDYLYDLPHVDRNRLAVTGLSGGGWQTILLSALDERVKVSIPVAGFSSIRTRVEVKAYGDLGDVEQSATDLYDGRDYTHLAALMAPRPTLLVYNAEDDCCFRAPLVKPLVFERTKPFFRLYGKESDLQWHENRDPGSHNYQLDNRLSAYAFLSKQFDLPPIDSEAGVAQEIKSYDDLVVGLPKDNLTILGLAQRVGRQIARAEAPADSASSGAWAAAERQKLASVVRTKAASITSTWVVANTKHNGVETKSYLFLMSNGLNADAVWLKAIHGPDNSPLTIVLSDKGKKGAGAEVAERVNRGEQVLAVDLLFSGDAWKDLGPGYVQIFHGLGDRPLGMRSAQLVEIAHWFQKTGGSQKIRLEATGIRSQVAALVASALEPNLFSSVVVHEGMPSLGYLLEAPVNYWEAPELFCLDLYKQFDLDRLTALAAPTAVTVERYVKPKKD